MTSTGFPKTVPTEPYRPRRIQSLGVVERAGWTIKLVGITAGSDLPDDGEVDAAVAVAERELPQPPRNTTRSGVGFCIVHRGTEALWVLVCWWELDIMYERLWRAELGSTELRAVPPDGPTACVWELLAIDHERRAWIDHVLVRPSAPDFAGYLTSTLTVNGPTP
jgi:hypothetical protein